MATVAQSSFMLASKSLQSSALKPQQVWAVRFWLDQQHRLRDRALVDVASTASYADAMW